MRSVFVLFGIALLSLVLAPASAQVTRPVAPVETSSGKLVGELLPSGVKAWLGVRYAAAPVGDLRWRAPKPVRWNGVFNADRFGPECIQYLRPHSWNQYFGEEATSEDCLTLNVWAPETAVGSKLPVVVFIHGGGSTAGSSSMPNYNGENLAKRGALVVSFNYRLGLLGFIAHPELTKEQGGHSGNYGYLDQVAALQWVHDNIASFGGDPAHVLIYGHSSGGLSAFQHLYSPLSKGLFSGAMLASACCNFRQQPLAEGEKIGLALQATLGVSDLAGMREAAADKILAQQADAQNPNRAASLRGANLIDGAFVTGPYLDAARAGGFADVPLLFVSTANDNDWGRNPLASVRTAGEYKAAAAKVYGDKAAKFLSLYPVKTDADAPVIAARAIVDSGMHGDSRNCARMLGRYGKAKSFIALYTHREPFVAGVKFTDRDVATAGAFHNSDTPYWLGAYEAYNLLRKTRDYLPADRAMSVAMSDMIVAFARSGDPSTSAQQWPAWSPGREQRLSIDRNIRSERLYAAGMDWLAQNPLAPGAALACTP
jgi:para-nitrobenzyl esterase